jgi:hypothetical protein
VATARAGDERRAALGPGDGSFVQGIKRGGLGKRCSDLAGPWRGDMIRWTAPASV